MCDKQLVFYITLCLGFSKSQNTHFNGSDTIAKGLDLYSTECTEDADCIPNSYCYIKRCICKSEFIPFKKEKKGPFKCIKQSVGIDDYCEEDIQCQTTLGAHAFCNKTEIGNIIGKCSCSENAHYTANICYPSAHIGQPCQVNDNCIIRSKNIKSYCDYGHCICPPRYHEVDGGKDCVATSELSGPCLTSDNCININSECKNGFCTCQSNYIHDSDNKHCLLAARRVGDPCNEDRQCHISLENTRCDMSEAVCRCQEGYHEVDGHCWRTRGLLERCEKTAECRHGSHHSQGAECHNNICQCMKGYFMEDRKICIKVEKTVSDGGNQISNKLSFYVMIIPLIFSFHDNF